MVPDRDRRLWLWSSRKSTGLKTVRSSRASRIGRHRIVGDGTWRLTGRADFAKMVQFMCVSQILEAAGGFQINAFWDRGFLSVAEPLLAWGCTLHGQRRVPAVSTSR
jgi:hypothetical protein